MTLLHGTYNVCSSYSNLNNEFNFVTTFFKNNSQSEKMRIESCNLLKQYLEGKYTEWPNPQITENHACDRQSGLNDSAPRNHILVA